MCIDAKRDDGIILILAQHIQAYRKMWVKISLFSIRLLTTPNAENKMMAQRKYLLENFFWIAMKIFDENFILANAIIYYFFFFFSLRS